MIIGTFAYCGSGQDTLADGFCRYKGFRKFSLGDVIRDIAKERHLPCKREILQKIREECDQIYGRKFVPEQLMKKIEAAPGTNIVITGIRTIEEYSYFKSHLNMIFVFVYADTEIRFQRMIARADEKDETSLSELKRRMDKENQLFDYKKLEYYADIKYNFNMNLDEYLNNEKHIVESLLIQIEHLSRLGIK